MWTISSTTRTGRILVSSRTSDQIYSIDPKTLEWKCAQTGYRIGLVRAAGERLVAASLYDGVLIEPQRPGRSETRAESESPRAELSVSS